MTALALEFGRVLGELERAGASVFEDLRARTRAL
jgi:hypothetical protein